MNYQYSYCPVCGELIKGAKIEEFKFRGFQFKALICDDCFKVMN